MRRKIFSMKAFKIILSLFFIFIIAAGIFCFYVYSQMQPSKGDLIEYSITVEPGASYLSISKILKENDIIKSDKVFYYYSRIKKASLKSGYYSVNNKMTFDEIHDLLNTGRQENYAVSIPEGLTITNIAKLLEEKGIVEKAEDFICVTRDKDLLAKYNIPAETFEGYLFPDTYYLTKYLSSEEILTIMVDNFYEKLETIENSTDLSPEELHETIKLASIVEKEYKVKDEAPLIASVFKNRLKYNIGLYSCATIIYIITEVQGLPHPGQVRYADLEIESPYNTYKYAGLPPTPISNPGLVALDASINTPKTNYYFFRVKDEAKGTHIFTTDFESHKEAGL